MNSVSFFIAPLVAIIVGSGAARAGTNNFVVPTFRNEPGGQTGYWEVFSVAYGAPGNTADKAGSTTSAVLTQTGSPSAFITGSGNLYDPEAITAFTLTDTTTFALGTVVLQTRTLGSEIDYANVQLSYLDDGGTHFLTPLHRVELDRGTILGASVSSLWQWDLTGLNVSEYSVSFAAAGPSLSFDAMTLDTWNQFAVVPEPSTLALLGVGSALLSLRLFRRRL